MLAVSATLDGRRRVFGRTVSLIFFAVHESLAGPRPKPWTAASGPLPGVNPPRSTTSRAGYRHPRAAASGAEGAAVARRARPARRVMTPSRPRGSFFFDLRFANGPGVRIILLA